MRSEDGYIGSPIRSMQTMLAAISADCDEICAVIPDGRFGKQTENSVKGVQLMQKMRATGTVDNATWNAIVSQYYNTVPKIAPALPLTILWQPNQTISPGDKNAHLFPIQSMLTVIGRVFPEMPPLSITGIHDAASVACIRWLEEKCGLPQNGQISALEWTYLSALYTLTAGDGYSSL